MALSEGTDTAALGAAPSRRPAILALKGIVVAAGVLAFAVLAGSGSLLAAVEQSGAQGLGSLLTFAAIIGLAAAALLVFAPERTFAAPGGRLGAAIAGLLAVLPVAALAVGLLRFARPFGGAPALDVPLSALGVLFVAGALAIAGLTVARLRTAPVAPELIQPSTREVSTRSQVLDMSLLKLRGAYDAAMNRETAGGESVEGDDGIRVTRVP